MASRRVIVDELEFDVPYGKLTAKTWHEETDECKRVLALHGWMDNSGSFDNLIPLIKHEPNGLYVVGLDLPGHGRSSQMPPGSSYTDLGLVMEIRRFLIELKWIQKEEEGKQVEGRKKFTILGHSLGACLGLFYTSLYPEDIDEIILIDFVKTRTFPTDKLIEVTRNTIDRFITLVPSVKHPSSMNNKSTGGGGGSGSGDDGKLVNKGQVVVSHETAIVATIEAHKIFGQLSRESAQCLLKRCTIDVSSPANSVLYFRDLRLQCMLHMREHIVTNEIMFGHVRCNAISILAKQGLYSKGDLYSDKLDEMLKYHKGNCKTYFTQWMNNVDHFLHMSEPQKTADIINKYLESPENYKETSPV